MKFPNELGVCVWVCVQSPVLFFIFYTQTTHIAFGEMYVVKY